MIFYQSTQVWWLRGHHLFFVCWLASPHTAWPLWWSAPSARQAGVVWRALCFALLVDLTFGTRGRHALTCYLSIDDNWYDFHQSIQVWWLRGHRFFFVCWLASHHTALPLWWSEFGGSESPVFARSCGLTMPHTAQPCWRKLTFAHLRRERQARSDVLS